MDEDSEDRKLDQIQLAEIKELEGVKKLIATTKGQTKTVKVGEEFVKIKAAIPRQLRLKIDQIARMGQDEQATTEEFEEELYKVMAELCVEEPWTNPMVWQYVDNETGETPNVFTKIMKEIYSDELKVQNFRKK